MELLQLFMIHDFMHLSVEQNLTDSFFLLSNFKNFDFYRNSFIIIHFSKLFPIQKCHNRLSQYIHKNIMTISKDYVKITAIR